MSVSTKEATHASATPNTALPPSPIVAMLSPDGRDDFVLRQAALWAQSEERELALALRRTPGDGVHPLMPHHSTVVNDPADTAAIATYLNKRRSAVLGPEFDTATIIIDPHGGIPDAASMADQLAPAGVVADGPLRVSVLLERATLPGPVWLGTDGGSGPVVALARPHCVERVVFAAFQIAARSGRPMLVAAEGVPHAELMHIETIARGHVARGGTVVNVEIRLLDGGPIEGFEQLTQDLDAYAVVVPWGPENQEDGVVARSLLDELHRPVVLV